MKYLYLIAAICFITTACYAQKQAVYFMKNSGKYVSTKDSADIIRVVNQPDAGSKLYHVFDFYKDGRGKMEAFSTTMDPINLEGLCRTFYNNTHQKEVATYKNNVKTGDVFEYFPNGNLYFKKNYLSDSVNENKEKISRAPEIIACNDSAGKSLVAGGNGHFIGYDDEFKNVISEGDVKAGKMTGDWSGYDPYMKWKFNEAYVDGKLINGTSIDSAGIAVNYIQQRIMPAYKGGIKEFYTFLSHTIRYPSVDREDNIQGVVILTFVISKEGHLSNITIFRSVSPAINAEALRVLRLSEGSWLPGSYYGRPVNSAFTIPINFSLGNR